MVIGEDDVYVVPEAPTAVTLRFPGEVQADRGQVVGIAVGTTDLVVERLAPDGAAVRMGDPLVTFENGIIARALPDREGDLVTAERTLALDQLKLDQQMEDLVAQKAQLEVDLAVCRAALARATAPDRAQAAQAEAEYRQVLLRADEATRAVERARALRANGEAADRDVASAEDAAAQARLDCEPARLRRDLAAAGDELAIAKLRLQERQLLARIGVSADGKPDPAAGINGRIASANAQQKRQRFADQTDRDRVSRQLHQAQRDACDHTPLRTLEIDGPKPLKVAFLPAPLTAPDGWTVDRGEAFDAARGSGWLDPARIVVQLRDGLAPAQAAGQADAGVALAQRRAVWRAVVPDGHYHVKAVFGDGVDWRGAVARLGDRAGPRPAAFFVADRIAGGAAMAAEADIDVVGGQLEVTLGDDETRAIRAPADGIALRKEGLAPGGRAEWREDPVAFFIDPGRITVRARAPMGIVPLLAVDGPVSAPTPGAPAATGVAAARTRVAASKAVVRAPSGAEARGAIAQIVRQPILPWRGPKAWGAAADTLDATANEVDIAVPPDEATKLPLGALVECRCQLRLAPGMVALPSHLVALADDRCWIQEEGGEPRATPAFRAGDSTVVISGLAPLTRLVPPRPRAVSAAAAGYTGEVVAGRRTQLTMPSYWGRIRELAPEGILVEKGQVIVRLYNPNLDARREQTEQDRKRANQAFQLAGEARRAKAVQVAIDRHDQELQERAARQALAAAAAPLLTRQADAEANEAKARIALAGARRELEGAEALKQYDLGRWQAARAAAGDAELALAHATLDLANARRGIDWLGTLDAEGAWRDALAPLGLREGDALVSRLDDQVAAASARLQLQQAMSGNWAEVEFKRIKDMRAPAKGRLFYLNGWNDQTNQVAKFEKDFYVWQGMSVAEVLDMSHLSFHAELPEGRYRRLAVGQAVELRFAQLDDRRLPGRVAALGHAFHLPKDAGGAQAIADQRDVTVTVDFEPPADLQDLLVPGTAGALMLDEAAPSTTGGTK